MNDSKSPKLSGISQIVRLKQMLQKWHSVALCSKVKNQRSDVGKGGISPVIKRRLIDVPCWESDEDSCYSPSASQSPSPSPSPGGPPDVPRGYLAVYVGADLHRFIIPTTYLSHSLFIALLEKAEDEFGYNPNGGLRIPCDIESFKSILRSMENELKRPYGDSHGKLVVLLCLL